MKVKIGILLVVAALAVVAAGSARADAPAAGDYTYIQCGDGTLWVLDSSWDAASFGEEICGGDYTVVADPAGQSADTGSADNSGDTGSTDGSDSVQYSGGKDVGLGADINSSPDAGTYVTDVQCPNGQIWAVASGSGFVCPK